MNEHLQESDKMNEQPDNRAPDEGQNHPLPLPRNWRSWLADVVGGGVMFGVMFVLHRLRPNRRRRQWAALEEEGISPEQAGLGETAGDDAGAPRIRVIESVGAGHFETAAGLYDAPPGVHEAPHSIWPIVVAAGVALGLFGLITSYAFTVFGLVIFVAGVTGWVSELVDE